ncbi:MAG: NifB/NifX family molybdenum-iron cluster-binding protein [Bacillota bacterium]|nr:NifB/NifX family molybdenum-iron cluster-binding protein [Bacillota bacterium]
MKIAIPVDSRGLDARVSANFGRANGFLFYDTETKAESYIENAARMARGGAGIQAAQTIVDQGAVALLTPRLGGNAADVLDEAGVKIYRSTGGTARDNVAAFAEGRLSLLDEVHEGFHGNPRP